MDIKTIEQALKLQSDLTAKLARRTEMLSRGRALSPQTMLKEKEEEAVVLQRELEAATQGREEATRRWDERIARRKADLATLQEEIAEIRRGLGGRGPADFKRGGRAKKPR